MTEDSDEAAPLVSGAALRSPKLRPRAPQRGPFGIARFGKLIREERNKIVRGQWLLLDLREAAAAEERRKEPR